MKKYIAESIGTFALVFVGAASVLISGQAGYGMVGIAFAHGLVLMAMIYSLGHVSGAHFNPAVTVSMVATRDIGPREGVMYIVSQLIGASIAGFLLLFSIGTISPGLYVEQLHLGVTDLAGIGFARGILIEAIFTFFLVFTVFSVAVDKRAPPGFYGIAIGFVLAACIIAGGWLTGAALNPARAFGPALASGYWDTQIVYWIGPIIGGLIAGLLHKNFVMGAAGGEKKKL